MNTLDLLVPATPEVLAGWTGPAVDPSGEMGVCLNGRLYWPTPHGMEVHVGSLMGVSLRPVTAAST